MLKTLQHICPIDSSHKTKPDSVYGKDFHFCTTCKEDTIFLEQNKPKKAYYDSETKSIHIPIMSQKNRWEQLLDEVEMEMNESYLNNQKKNLKNKEEKKDISDPLIGTF